MQGAAVGAGACRLVFIEGLVQRWQIAHDRPQYHFYPVHESAAFEAIPLERIFLAARARGFDHQAHTACHWPLR